MSTRFTQSNHQGSVQGKKNSKNVVFLRVSFKKNGGVRPKTLSFSDMFGMLMLYSDTHFLEASAHVSLKVASKGSFRDKNASEKLAF